MDFRLLGPLEVAEGGHPLALGGAKQRALLAVLLLHANDVVATERLIDELWGESPPATVAKSIQVYVSRLRKQLGDGRLVTRTPGYVLLVDASELDVARFERLLAEAAGANPAAAAQKLREALALWRGAPLADLAYEPFARAPIARLEELRLVALQRRVDAELASGRHAELVGELEALVGEHALRERLRGQLMLALYRSGRQAEALEAYRQARSALVEELGIEPGRQLRELHDAILQQDPRLDFAVVAERAHAPRTAFVGRDRELAELVGGLEDAFAGRGHLFLLVGEPGIGKSRLAEELMAHARARGARVLVGRCWEAGGAPAYWPWVQSLRAYVRDSDPAALRAELGPGAADLAQIVPDLRQRFPDLPEPPSPGSEGARFRMFDAAAQFLRNASQRRPIVLVLDDLHAADAPSLLLLQFLARELRSSSLLVLGAYRDVDPIPRQPLTDMLAELAREPVTRRLSLGGLSEGDVAKYVEMTAPEMASAGLVTALQEETEGNPLFVGELVRLLSAEGTCRDPADEVRLVIPESVQDVITRRVTHLSPTCKRVLGLACAIGREFELDVLARAADVSEHELLDTLDEAMAARVVSEVPGAPGRLRFAHVLIRDSSTTRSRPRAASGFTERSSRRSNRCAARSQAPISPSSRTTPCWHATPARACAMRRARRTGRSHSSRTRRRRGYTRRRSTRASAHALQTSGRTASFSSPSARRKRERGTALPRKRPSSTAPASPGASVSPANSLGQPPATGDGSSGCAPGATIDSCRCSRRGWPRCQTANWSSGRDFSPVSPVRFATNALATAATR
jgi:DNA-binding SARP family transcriptional activator